MKNYFKRDLVEICNIEVIDKIQEEDSEIVENIDYIESYIG